MGRGRQKRKGAEYSSLLDLESGTYLKKWTGRRPVALLYPNKYGVGVSSLGFQLVYSLLSDAQVINLHRTGRGKYFRMLADVEFDGQDLATALLNQDLAVKYSGGKRESHWCTESNKKISVRHNSSSVLPPKVSGVYVWPPPPVQKTTDTADKK